VGLEEIEAGLMMTFVGVDVGVQRPSVDQECDLPSSSLRISSMRSATSDCPLRPAAAAPSRLRPFLADPLK
jgi:hypothetical protein